MPNIISGQSSNVTLPAGHTLIISSSTVSKVSIYEQERINKSIRTVDNSSITYGPFTDNRELVISCLEGSVTYNTEHVDTLGVAYLSDTPPNDDDGRPDNSIIFFGGQYRIKRDGKYEAPTPSQAAEFRQAFNAEKSKGGVILYGDSRIQFEIASGPSASNGIYNNARGAFNIARAMHGSTIDVVVNAGVGGNTYADLLARFDTDVAPHIPSASTVYIMCGINDILADKTAAQIIADAAAVHKRFIDSGLTIIEVTDYPPAVGKELTAGRELVMMEVNRWKKSLVGSGKVYVIDSSAAIANAGSIPPSTAVNRILDPTGSGIHMNPGGAFLIAKKLVQILDVLYPRADVLIASAADTFSRNPSSTNLIDNPLFIGSGGTNGTGCSNDPAPPSGFVGGVPALWNFKRNAGTGTALTSYGPTGDSVGNVFRTVISGASAGNTFQLGQATSIRARATPLGKYVAKCKVTVKGATGLHTVYLRILAICDGVSYQWRDLAESIPATGSMDGDFTVTLKTPIATLPAFASCTVFDAQVLPLFSGAGGATIEVSQLSIEVV